MRSVGRSKGNDDWNGEGVFEVAKREAVNDEREPREAAASDSGLKPERNGCLPLAQRSGSTWLIFSPAPAWLLSLEKADKEDNNGKGKYPGKPKGRPGPNFLVRCEVTDGVRLIVDAPSPRDTFW